MYYKFINDRQVFSDCKSIQANDGSWISNPTEEEIFAAGWKVYVPPIIPPVPQTEPTYNEIVTAVKTMLRGSVEELSDEEALEIAALYPTWASKIGTEVPVGERLWYNEKLYKVIQAHTVQADWTPDVSASLYTEISIEEWPAWKQPVGASDAYNTGDKVSHIGKHWVSKIDTNVWEPGAGGTESLWEEK